MPSWAIWRTELGDARKKGPTFRAPTDRVVQLGLRPLQPFTAGDRPDGKR